MKKCTCDMPSLFGFPCVCDNLTDTGGVCDHCRDGKHVMKPPMPLVSTEAKGEFCVKCEGVHKVIGLTCPCQCHETKPVFQAKTIDELYASLPSIECKKLCAFSCTTIKPEPIEEKRIKQFCQDNGLEYHEFENLKNLYEQQMNGVFNVCPYLKDDKCSIYADRPLICRLWGVTEAMQCPHDCKVNGKLLTNREAKEFIIKARLL